MMKFEAFVLDVGIVHHVPIQFKVDKSKHKIEAVVEAAKVELARRPSVFVEDIDLVDKVCLLRLVNSHHLHDKKFNHDEAESECQNTTKDRACLIIDQWRAFSHFCALV